MIKNKRVLITGASGFIGANLARKFLELNAKVYIFTRAASNKWRISSVLKNVKEYCVDLLNYNKLEKIVKDIKPEIILHTAVYGGYPFQKNTDEVIQTNITGTINLVNACLKKGFNIFVNTGSSSEYGLKLNPMQEEDLLKPINHYGASKASATLFCQMKAISGELSIVTLRLFSPYGYYEEPTRLIPSIIKACLSGENPKLSSPKPVRDFVFIEDVMDAYIKVVENKNKVKREILNIGYGSQHSVEEIVQEVIAITKCGLKPEWGTAANPRIEPDTWCADISKAHRILGWQPGHNLGDGLSKTIEWFRENMELYKKNKQIEV